MWSKTLVYGCVPGLCPLCKGLSCLGAPEVQIWGLCLETCILSCVGFSGTQPGVEASLTKLEGWVCRWGVGGEWRGKASEPKSFSQSSCTFSALPLCGQSKVSHLSLANLSLNFF